MNLRILHKVFYDPIKNKYYWINISKVYKEIKKYNFDATKILHLLEETYDLEVIPNRKTISRAIGYIEGNLNKGNSISLTTIKALSKAMANGDEDAFIIEITKDNAVSILEKLCSKSIVDLTYIHDMQISVLKMIASSKFYQYKPGTNKRAADYYDKKILDIRKEINLINVNEVIRQKLSCLLNDIEFIVYSTDFPCVPDSWFEYNQNLSFYDASFDLLEKHPDLFMVDAKGNYKLKNSSISLKQTLSKENVERRKLYLETLEKRYKNQNLNYVYCYQTELVNTFDKIFNEEFRDYSG